MALIGFLLPALSSIMLLSYGHHQYKANTVRHSPYLNVNYHRWLLQSIYLYTLLAKDSSGASVLNFQLESWFFGTPLGETQVTISGRHVGAT